MENILNICKNLGVAPEECIPYGFDKAKIDLKVLDRLRR
jgi:formate--tetrahydrofolate ligase